MSDKRNIPTVAELIRNVRRETDPNKLHMYADILQDFGMYSEAARARAKAVEQQAQLEKAK